MSRTARTWLSRIGLLLASLLLALMLAEMIVRIAAPQPAAWLDIFRPHPSLPFYAMQPNIQRSIDTGEGRWTVFTDDNGFRRGEATAAPVNAPVTLIIGDSFAFGLGVNYEECFAGRLAAREASSRVIDAGVNGYGPAQYRAMLEHLLASGPAPERVIVSTYPANDFSDCLEVKNVAVVDGILANERSLRAALKRNSHLFRLAARARHQNSERRVPITPAERQLCTPSEWEGASLKRAAEIYREQFAAMAAACKSRGIPLLVVLIPFDASIAPPDGALEYTLPNEKARAILADLRIPLVDPTDRLKRIGLEKAYFAHNRHLTAAGHEAVLEALIEKVP